MPQGTSIVGSPTPITTANQGLAPETGESFELGGKYSLLDGQLGLTGSVFQETKANATITDPLVAMSSCNRARGSGCRAMKSPPPARSPSDLSLIAAYT